MKGVIFDFDGVISDSMSIVYDITEKYLHSLGKDIGSTRTELHKMNSRQRLKALHIHLWQIPKYLSYLRYELNIRYGEVSVFPEMKEVVRKLAANYRLGLVTTSPEVYVTHILNKANILECFSHMDFRASLWDKSSRLKHILKKLSLKKDQVLYVGDEDRDVLSSHKAGLKAIGVTWGFDDANVLRAAGADYVVGRPLKLIEVLNEA